MERPRRPNAELRCLAFLGIAAIHISLNDPAEMVAEKMAFEAVFTDSTTAEKWLSKKIVSELLTHNPNLGQVGVLPPSTQMIPSTARHVGFTLLHLLGPFRRSKHGSVVR